MIADMNLSKAVGLAKVAKDAAAIENITPGEALEKLLMAIESGASRGLRTMGIILDVNQWISRRRLSGRISSPARRSTRTKLRNFGTTRS